MMFFLSAVSCLFFCCWTFTPSGSRALNRWSVALKAGSSDSAFSISGGFLFLPKGGDDNGG